MKIKLILLSVILVSYSAIAQDDSSLKKFAKKNKDILSLNAIVADKTYYSQAILEYQLIKKVYGKYSSINAFTEINDGKTVKYKEVSLLKSITQQQVDFFHIKPCMYRLPEKLEDLKSGFQFRHYLFRAENKTALQAFGIINNQFNKNELYVVIDYIQYQDCGCSDLPKIRYAVGIRTEFKISGINLNKNQDKNTSNLNIEKLAANVEFDKLKVDISMKTIGITGKLARLNIPTNTSFNVQTYGEYVKVIDFIRNSIDTTKDVTIQPEIIPVMDEYRTSISDINTSAFDEILEIRKRYDKYYKELSKTHNDYNLNNIDDLLKKSLYDEITEKDKKRNQLTQIDASLKNLDKYMKVLEFISTAENKDETGHTKALTPTSTPQEYESLKERYNAAIDLIINKDRNAATAKLKEIYKERNDYGSVYEILNLLSNENDDKVVFSEIATKYSWLIDPDKIKTLKEKSK